MMETALPKIPLPEDLAGRIDQLFPKLTNVQISRVEPHGHIRQINKGEILVEAGDQAVPFFVVKRGRIEAIRTYGDREALITEHGPGQFTGEAMMLSGRPALARLQAAESGEVIEMNRESLLALVQTDAELGEIIMRAFILRRMGLIANRLGDVIVLGSSHCANTLRIKEFLARNGHPYQYIDLDRERDVQEILDRFHVGPGDIPVVICRGELVLRKPTNEQIAECLGFNEIMDPALVRDLVIVGAGPAGLAAAVYAASEGLDVLVLETTAPGGQAGTSSKIENYLGFPNGISGQELAARAYGQAQKFGAQFAVARNAQRLVCDRRPYAIEMGNGASVLGKTIIIATGAKYRKLPLDNLSRFEGVGIYYAATYMESQLCGGDEVIVVGGGNSAGQAAVFLSQTARGVHLLVRSGDLAASMSRYLIRRIEESPAITVHSRSEIEALEGGNHLEGVRWRDHRTGSVESHPIRHVFLMMGANPSSEWLDGCLVLDSKGFIKTGTDLSQDELAEKRWDLARPPRLLETSLPGVFAVGDVRASNIKRVASAVGEGSVAVAFVHQALSE